MNRSITVCHGSFGRLCYTELNRSKALHATRAGQLLFLIDGDDVVIKINKKSVLLSTDRAIAIDSFSAYEIPNIKSPKPSSESTDSSTGESAKLLSIFVDPMWCATRCANVDPEWLSFDAQSFEINAEIKQHVEHLLSLVKPPAPSRELGYDAALETRLCHLCNACFPQADEHNVTSPPPTNPISVCDSRIRKSLSIMNNHVRGDLGLDEIARAAGLSRPHFYRLFRDNLGFTPNVYMNLLRMEFAVERLAYGDQPVTAIALDLGFASQASFTRFFGANQGIPPTDYRRLVCLPASATPRATPGNSPTSQQGHSSEGTMQLPPSARIA